METEPWLSCHHSLRVRSGEGRREWSHACAVKSENEALRARVRRSSRRSRVEQLGATGRGSFSATTVLSVKLKN